jgi:hypothetical protein
MVPFLENIMAQTIYGYALGIEYGTIYGGISATTERRTSQMKPMTGERIFIQ